MPPGPAPGGRGPGGVDPAGELLRRVGADVTSRAVLAGLAKLAGPRLGQVAGRWLPGFRSALTRRAYAADLIESITWCAPRDPRSP